ncbi:MAG: thioredoxin domain-containing protein [Bdellovibrionales bacterium]|nr:thioredoxin domain-containing protein [Bdellovibrionales bacterium]
MKSAHRILAALTALCGLGLAVLSLIHDVGVLRDVLTGPSFCSIDGFFDCEKVAASPYSTIHGIPISAFALLFYLCFSALLLLHPSRTDSQRQRLADISAVLALTGLLASVAMFCISTLLIGAYCLYCSGLYLVSLVLAFTCLRPPFSFKRLISGASALIWFGSLGLIGHRQGWNRSIARLGMLVIVAAAFFLYQAPEMIVRYYYKPKSIDEVPDAAVGELVLGWREQPKVEIPLKTAAAGSDQDYALGPESAEITIVEFSDFECPFCKKASYMLKEAIEPYGSKIRFVFKNFPLDQSCNELLKGQMHLYACKAALIARCAGEQNPDLFWAAHDAIFSEEELNQAALDRILQELSGQAVGELQQCLASPHQMDRIKEDINTGLELEVRSTPTIYINGRKLPRADKITLEAVLRHLTKN